MKVFVAFIVVVAMLAAAQAQFTFKGKVVFEGQGGFVIPDPNNKLSLASLLNNPSVAKALGIGEAESQVLKSTLEANYGSFNSVRYVRPDGSLPTSAEEIIAFRDAQHAKSTQLLDEVIAPHQWEKLRQLAYQTEVARIGLGDAFVRGRLGQDVGIVENQKTNISEKSAKIEARLESAITKLLLDAQNELLLELSSEQREKAKKCLGMPFLFRDNLRFAQP